MNKSERSADSKRGEGLAKMENEEAKKNSRQKIADLNAKLKMATAVAEPLCRLLEDLPEKLSSCARNEWLMEKIRREVAAQNKTASECRAKIAALDRERAISKDEEYARLLQAKENRPGAPRSLEAFNIENLKGMIKDPYKARFSCGICLEDEFELSDVLILKCKHSWALNCLRKFFTTEMDNSRSSKIKCPDDECEHMVLYQEVHLCLSKAQFERYDRLILESGLQQDPDVRWCPKNGCGMAMIGSKDEHPRLECPKCKFKFCFNCGTEEWHVGATCLEFQQWKKDNNAGATTFEKWRKKNTKKCPKCHCDIQKNGGCDHMTCARCRHQFWWKDLTKYEVDERALNALHVPGGLRLLYARPIRLLRPPRTIIIRNVKTKTAEATKGNIRGRSNGQLIDALHGRSSSTPLIHRHQGGPSESSSESSAEEPCSHTKKRKTRPSSSQTQMPKKKKKK